MNRLVTFMSQLNITNFSEYDGFIRFKNVSITLFLTHTFVDH